MKTPIEMLNAIIEMQEANYGNSTNTHLDLITLVKEAKNVVKNCSIDDVMGMLPTEVINRVEVIDEKGRSYVNWKPTNRTELHIQDNGKTLKVFISQGN